MGMGGVGTYATETLARSGIGRFLLVDFDKITVSNINRQLPALHSNIGEYKTEAMKSRILDINPFAEVEVYNDFCALESRSFLLQNNDFVIDAIDSLGPKVGLLEEAYNLGVKIISVFGAAGRIDPSQIEITDISKTRVCPLGKRVRKFLRRRGIESGITVVFSKEVPIDQFPYEAGSEKDWPVNRGRKRGTLGSVVYIPAIMGMWAASHVLRELSAFNKNI